MAGWKVIAWPKGRKGWGGLVGGMLGRNRLGGFGGWAYEGWLGRRRVLDGKGWRQLLKRWRGILYGERSRRSLWRWSEGRRLCKDLKMVRWEVAVRSRLAASILSQFSDATCGSRLADLPALTAKQMRAVAARSRGVNPACAQWEAVYIGGDLNHWPQHVWILNTVDRPVAGGDLESYTRWPTYSHYLPCSTVKSEISLLFLFCVLHWMKRFLAA